MSPFLNKTTVGFLLIVASFWLSKGIMGQDSHITTTITINEVIAGYRQLSGEEKLKSAISQASQSWSEVDSQLFPKPFELDTKVDVPSNGGDFKYEAMMKRQVALGKNSSNIQKRRAAEGEATFIKSLAELREGELALGRAFVLVRIQSLQLQDVTEFLKSTEPLVLRLNAASRAGSIGGLTSAKWQLTLQSQQAEQKQLRDSIDGLQEFIALESGLSLTHLKAATSLDAVTYSFVESDTSKNPEVMAAGHTQTALAAQIAQVGSGFTVDAGIGLGYDHASHERALILEMALPLGQMDAASQEIKALHDQASVMQQTLELKKSRLKQRLSLAKLESARARQSIAVQQNRIDTLNQLLDLTSRVARLGQGDVQDELDLRSARFETRLKIIEQLRNLDEIAIETKFALTGGLL